MKPTREQAADKKILLDLLGGTATLKEDFISITSGHRIFEYKPNVDKGSIAQAIGKLVQGMNAHERRYKIKPTMTFITRRLLAPEVIYDFVDIGASVQLLKRDNTLEKMA